MNFSYNIYGGFIMDFKELKYVLCIAKYKSVTKAARELYVSQSTLSKFLKKIEDRMGTKIFHHIDNQFTPTYIGERYIEYANIIMNINEKWDEELKKLLSLENGELTIAFPLFRSYCIIPYTLPEFKKIHKNIHVNILEEAYDVEGKLLNNEKIDIAIFNKPGKHLSLEYEILGEDETLLLVSRNHPLAKKGTKVEKSKYPWIDLKLFKNDEFILLDSDLHTGKISVELFERLGIVPKVAFRTRNVELQAQMAAQGFGVCFISESYLKHIKFENDPVCFSIGNPRIVNPIVVAYRKGAYLTKYTLDYIQILKKYFDKI
jgi:DNA-binding transcriptional LysR family regulator